MTNHASPHAPTRPTFLSPAAEAEFFAAYDAVLAQWPVPVESVDVPSVFGSTHVLVCGPADAPPLLLLHGGGATATVWFNDVAALSERHRVCAVDQIGDAGRSVHHGRPLRTAADFAVWLDALLDALGLPTTALAGHSYGGWLALTYALHAPQRVRQLVLLDPTGCIGGMELAYRLRAVPLFVRPRATTMRGFLAWETRHAPLDPAWLHLTALAGGAVQTSRVVMPRRPEADELQALTVPTLVLLAGRSRSLDTSAAVRTCHRLLSDAEVDVLPEATHHTIPTLHADQLDQRILDFLDRTAQR